MREDSLRNYRLPNQCKMASTPKQDNQSNPELLKQEAYNRLAANPDYLNHLKPLLLSAFSNLWPDPAQPDFDRKYIIQYSKAMAFKEVYDLLETAKGRIEAIREKMAEPKKNYEI